MTRTSFALASFGLVVALGSTPRAAAQETVVDNATPRVQRAVDLARDAMRREAEAVIRAREKQFDRLRAIPPAPIPPLRIQAGGVVREIMNREREKAEEREDGVPAGPELLVAAECFDQLVFGTTGDAASGRAHANTQLISLIDRIERTRRLTPAQRRKLLLAGQGDIKRLFDTIEDRRKEFELVRADIDRCEQLLNSLMALRRRVARGPFESESLVLKALTKIVNEEKSARRQPDPGERAAAAS